MSAATVEALSDRIHEAADDLIAYLQSAPPDDPRAFWRTFVESGKREAASVASVVVGDGDGLGEDDADFIAERITGEVDEWVKWLDESRGLAGSCNAGEYYETAHGLIVASLWYRLAYPLLFGWRDGALNRAPFAVELALITDEDGRTTFGPHLEDVEEQAEVEARRAFLLAEIDECGGATEKYAPRVAMIRQLAPDVVRGEDLDALEEALIDRYAILSDLADDEGRQRMVSWLRMQARLAAIKLIRAKHPESDRLREFLAKKDDDIGADLCNGIHRLRVAAGL